jgi:hypothetical protein
MRKNMTTRKNLLWMFAGVGALFIGVGPRDARASSITDTITVDTAGLASSPDSEIFFYLIGDGDNTATLSSFAFGGGSAGAFDSLNSTGSVSGAMTSSVSINDDSSFTNIFAQYFQAGTDISFVLTLTTNVASGPTPDEFGFAILDPSGNPIPTSDPTGNDNLVLINVDSSSPAVSSYSDLVTVTPVGAVATPEPSAALLLGTGMLALVWFSRRRSGASFARRIQ